MANVVDLVQKKLARPPAWLRGPDGLTDDACQDPLDYIDAIQQFIDLEGLTDDERQDILGYIEEQTEPTGAMNSLYAICEKLNIKVSVVNSAKIGRTVLKLNSKLPKYRSLDDKWKA